MVWRYEEIENEARCGGDVKDERQEEREDVNRQQRKEGADIEKKQKKERKGIKKKMKVMRACEEKTEDKEV